MFDVAAHVVTRPGCRRLKSRLSDSGDRDLSERADGDDCDPLERADARDDSADPLDDLPEDLERADVKDARDDCDPLERADARDDSADPRDNLPEDLLERADSSVSSSTSSMGSALRPE